MFFILIKDILFVWFICINSSVWFLLDIFNILKGDYIMFHKLLLTAAVLAASTVTVSAETVTVEAANTAAVKSNLWNII